MSSSMSREISHYVVTCHPPGAVLKTVKCNFLSKESEDVIIGKSRRLEVRQLVRPDQQGEEDSPMTSSSPFPVVFSCPINGRITSLVPLTLAHYDTALLFITTDQYQYAVIGYQSQTSGGMYQDDDDTSNNCMRDDPHASHHDGGRIHTYASGSLKDDWTVLGTLSEVGPLVVVDPHMRCLALHLYDGLVTIFPILPPSSSHVKTTTTTTMKKNQNNNRSKILGPVFHARLEERTVLAMCMLHHYYSSDDDAAAAASSKPHLTLLHQDSRGAQHISTHIIDLGRTQLWSVTSAVGQQQTGCEWLKKSRIDGGSSLLIPVPPLGSPVASTAAISSTGGPSANNRNSGGVIILGQRQITYCALNSHKVLPIPPGLILSWDTLPPDASGMPRFLLGDEFGNLHLLTLITRPTSSAAGTVSSSGSTNKLFELQLDTLGSCTLTSSLQYLDQGLVFCGSTLGDSQLVQIHDEPIAVEDEEEDGNDGDDDDQAELGETTYLSVIEEYTHLGPIVDFDLVPMAGTGEQSQVVTASGSSKSGSLRVIRNGIGMKEYASVELSGIQDMWSLRKEFTDAQDTYLVQSFVGETRVLGVASLDADRMEDSQTGGGDDAMEDDGGEEKEEGVGGTLEEVFLPGLESTSSTLFITNVVGDVILQITETQVRVIDGGGSLLDSYSSEAPMTVATANEAGQILIAIEGGKIVHLEIKAGKLQEIGSKQMDREVSCLDIHSFSADDGDEMQDGPSRASLCAVGLWDDFTVRLLTISRNLPEVLQIHLSTDEEEEEDDGQRRSNRNNMMARSLLLLTLDFSSSSTSGQGSSKKLTAPKGVNMLFVGLGDGTLVSFAVMQDDGRTRVQSRKEVSLGTQRINLIPLQNAKGGSCVLATGDRPTVIYLTGSSTAQNSNPKLCYSNVNLSPADDADDNDVSRPHAHESIAVNVAAPFFSPLLFDAMGDEHYSLCVADDANLRLGVIDDIQKLHVTTCRLGMAPRRIVHYPEGSMFAVGCIESGIKQVGMGGGEMNMGNCIRFLDDVTFDDFHRIDLEPCEMVLSMISATMAIHKPSSATPTGDRMDTPESTAEYKAVVVVGTAYALHNEDEPTKGRIMVLACDDESDPNNRKIKTVAELQVRGGVYSMCQFYDGRILITVNSKTQMCQLVDECTGVLKLSTVGVGHHGHILSLFVSSRASKTLVQPSTAGESLNADLHEGKKKPAESRQQLAIVGDLMRSISLVQHYPEHNTLEEVARDFNANWTTAVSMLTNDVYLGGENWNNLFVLRRNTKATSEEVRCRLDTVGEFHLGEMVNKFMSGSLVMPTNSHEMSSKSAANRNRRRSLTSPIKGDGGKRAASSPKGSTGNPNRSRRPVLSIGSQTLFGTTEGTLGAILGLDGPTTAFFSCLERAMQKVVKPIGNFSHQRFRAFNAEQRQHPSHGFVDGDLVESFLDLDKASMERVVKEMNRDGDWESDDSAYATGGTETDAMEVGSRPELLLDDVLALVEEMSMLH